MTKVRFAALIIGLMVPAAASLGACGGGNKDSDFDAGDPTEADGGGGGDEGGSPFAFGEGGPTNTDSGAAPCVEGLCKQQVACANGAHTTVSGTVYDPAGNTPLYNVLVYVPNDPDKVAPIQHGATCDRCGSVTGNPLVSAITDTKGNFTLKDVPVGTDIPLIIQVGKWRRQLKLPTVTQCVDNPLSDKSQTRLPKNQSEGDIPLIAVTTGGADTLECFLRSSKLGLDESEFSLPTGSGSVHFYKGDSNPDGMGDGIAAAQFSKTDPGIPNPGSAFPNVTSLWSDVKTLSKYDLVLLSCEGAPGNSPQTDNKNSADYDAMYQYLSNGGRMFATHWHYIWFGGQSELAMAGTNWGKGNAAQLPATITGDVNDTFPKGEAFRDWLLNVGASTTKDQLTIQQPRYNVDQATSVSTSWISINGNTGYLTVNTPIGADDDHVCGRAVFSDLHVGGATIGNKTDTPQATWPNGCATTGMSAQEKALEFLLFDLSACVQSDTQPPAPPPPGVK